MLMDSVLVYPMTVQPFRKIIVIFKSVPVCIDQVKEQHSIHTDSSQIINLISTRRTTMMRITYHNPWSNKSMNPINPLIDKSKNMHSKHSEWNCLKMRICSILPEKVLRLHCQTIGCHIKDVTVRSTISIGSLRRKHLTIQLTPSTGRNMSSKNKKWRGKIWKAWTWKATYPAKFQASA